MAENVASVDGDAEASTDDDVHNASMVQSTSDNIVAAEMAMDDDKEPADCDDEEVMKVDVEEDESVNDADAQTNVAAAATVVDDDEDEEVEEEDEGPTNDAGAQTNVAAAATVVDGDDEVEEEEAIDDDAQTMAEPNVEYHALATGNTLKLLHIDDILTKTHCLYVLFDEHMSPLAGADPIDSLEYVIWLVRAYCAQRKIDSRKLKITRSIEAGMSLLETLHDQADGKKDVDWPIDQADISDNVDLESAEKCGVYVSIGVNRKSKHSIGLYASPKGAICVFNSGSGLKFHGDAVGPATVSVEDEPVGIALAVRKDGAKSATVAALVRNQVAKMCALSDMWLDFDASVEWHPRVGAFQTVDDFYNKLFELCRAEKHGSASVALWAPAQRSGSCTFYSTWRFVQWMFSGEDAELVRNGGDWCEFEEFVMASTLFSIAEHVRRSGGNLPELATTAISLAIHKYGRMMVGDKPASELLWTAYRGCAPVDADVGQEDDTYPTYGIEYLAARDIRDAVREIVRLAEGPTDAPRAAMDRLCSLSYTVVKVTQKVNDAMRFVAAAACSRALSRIARGLLDDDERHGGRARVVPPETDLHAAMRAACKIGSWISSCGPDAKFDTARDRLLCVCVAALLYGSVFDEGRRLALADGGDSEEYTRASGNRIIQKCYAGSVMDDCNGDVSLTRMIDLAVRCADLPNLLVYLRKSSVAGDKKLFVLNVKRDSAETDATLNLWMDATTGKRWVLVHVPDDGSVHGSYALHFPHKTPVNGEHVSGTCVANLVPTIVECWGRSARESDVAYLAANGWLDVPNGSLPLDVAWVTYPDPCVVGMADVCISEKTASETNRSAADAVIAANLDALERLATARDSDGCPADAFAGDLGSMSPFALAQLVVQAASARPALLLAAGWRRAAFADALRNHVIPGITAQQQSPIAWTETTTFVAPTSGSTQNHPIYGKKDGRSPFVASLAVIASLLDGTFGHDSSHVKYSGSNCRLAAQTLAFAIMATEPQTVTKLCVHAKDAREVSGGSSWTRRAYTQRACGSPASPSWRMCSAKTRRPAPFRAAYPPMQSSASTPSRSHCPTTRRSRPCCRSEWPYGGATAP